MPAYRFIVEVEGDEAYDSLDALYAVENACIDYISPRKVTIKPEKFDVGPSGLTDAQILALAKLSARYGEPFDPRYFIPQFDLPTGYVGGWIGGYGAAERHIYVGCSPEGEISS